MPALIGGFGNKSSILFLNNFSKSSNCESFNLYTQTSFEKEDSSMDLQSNSQLGSYLAGLIEGDEICCKR
jgi:hypothetical protein